jgi:hypothetical protein
LQRLITRKDSAHYGLTMIAAGEASKMVRWASQLVAAAQKVIEA